VSAVTPQDRLAQLERARAEREKSRAAAAELALVEAAIRNEERIVRLEAAVAAAEKVHGPDGKKILVVHAAYPDGEIVDSVIVHAPSAVAWKAFKHGSRQDAKPSEKEVAVDRLWRACLVSPAEDEVNKLVDRFPILADDLAAAACRLAGFRTEEVKGK
jgi:hypothetical protein